MGTFRLHSGDDEWHERMAREAEEEERKRNTPEEKAARAFRDDLFALYKKHGLSIAHQDGQGAFIIMNRRMDQNMDAIRNAEVSIREPKPKQPPTFNPNPAELNHDHKFLYDED